MGIRKPAQAVVNTWDSLFNTRCVVCGSERVRVTVSRHEAYGGRGGGPRDESYERMACSNRACAMFETDRQWEDRGIGGTGVGDM